MMMAETTIGEGGHGGKEGAGRGIFAVGVRTAITSAVSELVLREYLAS